MSLILKNACYIDWESLRLSDTNLRIEEGENGSVEFYPDFNKIAVSPKDEVIDCKGKYVTKSFALGHHHAYSALSRGMPAPKKSPTNFFEI